MDKPSKAGKRLQFVIMFPSQPGDSRTVSIATNVDMLGEAAATSAAALERATAAGGNASLIAVA